MSKQINVVEKDEPDGITCHYIVAYKQTKGSEVKLSKSYSSREVALHSIEYTNSEFKRIMRLEVSEAWLKRL